MSRQLGDESLFGKPNLTPPTFDPEILESALQAIGPMTPTQSSPKPSLIYLASPYYHPRREIMYQRFRAVSYMAGELMKAGNTVFCPIAHSHPIDTTAFREDPQSHEFWMAQDLPLLEMCDMLVVARLPGWHRSRGVAEEISFAADNGTPYIFMDPDPDDPLVHLLKKQEQLDAPDHD